MTLCFDLLQEDSSILEKTDLSLHSRMAVQLRLAEKMILEKALASGRAKRLHFEKQLEEGAPLPDYHQSSIALLENTDAKLPIILHKLGEIQEGQEIQFEETGGCVNVDKAMFEMNVQGNEQALKQESQDASEETKNISSASDSLGAKSQNSKREVTGVGASRI